MRLVIAILSLAGLIVLSMIVVIFTSVETTFYVISSLVIAILRRYISVSDAKGGPSSS
jgi:hypothetical protein